MADPTLDITAEADETGTDPAAIKRRLTRVSTILQTAATRMAAIQAGWSVPGDPDQPAILALLNSVNAVAQRSSTIAQALIATIPTTGR